MGHQRRVGQGRSSSYRISFFIPIQFDDFWRVVSTLFSTLLYPLRTHLSVFLPLSFSLLSFSTSSRGRRLTIDDDTRIRPGSSTDRSTERSGESVKTDEAVAMRSFYTDPYLHLLHTPSSSSFSSLSCSSCVNSNHIYLPTYLPSVFHVARSNVFSLSETCVSKLYT